MLIFSHFPFIPCLPRKGLFCLLQKISIYHSCSIIFCFFGMETGHVIENAKKGNCPRGACRKTDKLEMILQKMCKMEGCELFWLIQIYTLLELQTHRILTFVCWPYHSHFTQEVINSGCKTDCHWDSDLQLRPWLGRFCENLLLFPAFIPDFLTLVLTKNPSQ